MKDWLSISCVTIALFSHIIDYQYIDKIRNIFNIILTFQAIGQKKVCRKLFLYGTLFFYYLCSRVKWAKSDAKPRKELNNK